MSKFDIQEQLSEDSVFVVGSVFGVKGKDIVIKVNKDKNLPHLFFKGRAIRNVSVGLSNYVKILKGFTEIICKVEGEYLEEDKGQIGKQYSNEKSKINRYLNISVFGFYDSERNFQHGIKEMPLIGNECRLLSRDEFEKLHKLSAENEISIKLGALIDEPIQEIKISAKKLFAGHIGIFGNTGSGKSNTLAKMYTELFSLSDSNENIFNKSKFIFIDFNGEYSKTVTEGEVDGILTNKKKVYRLSTRTKKDKYPISKSEIEKLELLSILLDATEKTQQPFLHRAIDRDYFDKDNQSFEKEIASLERKIKAILTKNDSTYNKPFLDKFVADFERIGFKLLNGDNLLNSLGYNTQTRGFYLMSGNTEVYVRDTNLSTFVGDTGHFKVSVSEDLSDLQQIQFKILDQYYYELLEGHINQEHIGPLMGRLRKRFEMLSNVFEIKTTDISTTDNIEVIDLKNVNLELKKVVPLLICKSSYDVQKEKRDTNKDNSLHIIIDEAHNILSENSSRESESWKDYRLETFEEIIKEGRKFGVFLTISSQRPSDISPTIISQLHNYFIHKLMNDNDLKSINKAVSYLDKLSFDSISNLSTGSCFIAGQLSQFPLSVKVDLLGTDLQPQSETIDLNKLWT